MTRSRLLTSFTLAAVAPLVAVAGGCSRDEPAAALAASPARAASAMRAPDHRDHTAEMDPDDRAAAMLATAAFQDVAAAESAGYASSIDALGCFENPVEGGMGVHYINDALMDAEVDLSAPEALVYELGPDGAPVALVAHEYIVPVDAWTSDDAPQLAGVDFHRHSTLPLWVLHTWLWKDNPSGVLADWNPAVRLCPAGVPIFGTDLGPGTSGV